MPLIFDTLPIKRIEADLSEAEGRTASTRTASWMRFKSFFPSVTAPVFHATSGPRAAMIALRGEGIKAESGYSNFGGQSGISLSRDLSFLLKGGFGNVIFVLDYQSLARRFDVTPIQHPAVGDEFEERVYTDLIPTSMIKGVIINAPLLRSIAQEWVDSVPYPVVHLSKDRTTWVRADGPFKTATLDESEKEEREDKRLIQKDTKFKPPRQDLRRRDVEDRDTRGDDDSDEKQDKKDRSKNYKDAAAIQRVAVRYMANRILLRLAKSKSKSKKHEFLKEYGDTLFKSPETGNMVNLRTLSSGTKKERKVYQQEYAKWKNTAADSPIPQSVVDEAVEKVEGQNKSQPSQSDNSQPSQEESKEPAVSVPSKTNLDKFNKFKRTLGYKSRSMVDLIDEDEIKDFADRVLQERDQIKENLKNAAPEKLLEVFEKASKDLEKESDNDSTDLDRVANLMGLLWYQNELVGGRTDNDIQNKIKKDFEDFKDSDNFSDVQSAINDLPLFSQDLFTNEFNKQYQDIEKDALNGLEDPNAQSDFQKKVEKAKAYFSSEVVKKRKTTDPKEAAMHAAVLKADFRTNDPMVRFKVPEGSEPVSVSAEEQAASNDDFANQTYQKLVDDDTSVEKAKEHGDRIYKQIQALPEGNARDKAVSAFNAIRVYQISRTKPNEDVEGVIPYVANAIRAAHLAGSERDFFNTRNEQGKSDAERLQILADKTAFAYNQLTEKELVDFLDEDHPLKDAKDMLKEYITPSARAFLRSQMIDSLVGEFRFSPLLHSDYAPTVEDARSETHEKISEELKRAEDSNGRKILSMDGMRRIKDYLADYFKKLAKFFSDLKSKTKQKAQGIALSVASLGFSPTSPPIPSALSRQASRVARRYIENSGRSFIRGSY